MISKRFYAVALCVAFLPCANAQESSEIIENGSSAISNRITLDLSKIENTVSISPHEVLFGDAFYVSRVYQNATDSETLPYSGSSVALMDDVVVILSFDQKSYLYVFDRSKSAINYDAPYGRNLVMEQGEMRIGNAIVAETPPLEDWESPFWRAVREEFEKSGRVELNLFVRINLYPSRIDYGQTWFTDSITIKKRPESEMTLFDKWRRDVEQGATPVIRVRPDVADAKGASRGQDGDENLKLRIGIAGFPYEKYVPSPVNNNQGNVMVPVSDPSKAENATSTVSVALNDVLRSGNRKPSYPNTPGSLEEWRTLEKELSPGSVRDEARLTALTLDYLAARQVGAHDVDPKKRR